MSKLGARVRTNLGWLIVFSAGIVMLAMIRFLGGVFFGDKYDVTVPLPAAGGVLPDQEVTVLGKAVGVVKAVDLVEEGVLLTLEIDGSQEVPRDSDVRVLRRSPIGEQAVDFQPTSSDWKAAERGARIVPDDVILPPEVAFLLEETVKLFRAVDKDDIATIIDEAAEAFGGRGVTLKQLNRNALDFQRTMVDGIPQFERLIDSSVTILGELQEHRQALGESFTNAAELSEIFAEQRPTLSALLDSGAQTLNQADALIRNERANFSCLNEDFIAFNEMLTGPSTATGSPARFYDSKLDEIRMALNMNRRFFQEGFAIITQPDPRTGAMWQRIQFIAAPEGGQAYPQKRTAPVATPGAACVTDAFGVGVNAVRQPDHQKAFFTAPPPEIDFAPLVEKQEGRVIPPPDREQEDPAPTQSTRRFPTPATGGGLAGLGAGLAVGALWLGRRSWR